MIEVEQVPRENNVGQKRLKRQKVAKRPMAEVVPTAKRLRELGQTEQPALAARRPYKVGGLEEMEKPEG